MKHGLQLLKVHALFSILVLLAGVVPCLHEHDQIISHEFFSIIDAIPQGLFVYATARQHCPMRVVGLIFLNPNPLFR